MYNVAHPYRGFPTNMVSLLKYDVVINSDIYREAFTPEQPTTPCRWWSSTEADSDGRGRRRWCGSYDKTVIDKLMPVAGGNRDSVAQLQAQDSEGGLRSSDHAGRVDR